MALETNYAEPITKIIKGSVLINTTPIEGGYLAFCHTHLVHDIRQMAGFTPVAEYGQMKPVHPREIGAVEDVRYIRSPDLPPFSGAGASGTTGFRNNGSNFDVYPILYVGMHAYGMVPLAGRERHGAGHRAGRAPRQVGPAGPARLRRMEVVVPVPDPEPALDGPARGRGDHPVGRDRLNGT